MWNCVSAQTEKKAEEVVLLFKVIITSVGFLQWGLMEGTIKNRNKWKTTSESSLTTSSYAAVILQSDTQHNKDWLTESNEAAAFAAVPVGE